MLWHTTLAYVGVREFGSLRTVDLFFEVLPYALGAVLVCLVVYVPSSAIVQYASRRWLGVVVYIAGIVLLTAYFQRPRGYGPAAIGVQAGLVAAPLLGVALVGKMIVLYVRKGRATTGRKAPLPPTPAPASSLP